MKNRNIYSLKSNNHKPFLFNLVLWLCSFVIVLFAFSQDSNPTKIDYVYTGSFIITILLPVLINLYVLIPKFLKREKYILFIITFVINLLLFSQLNILFFEYFIDYIFPDYYFISYHSNTKLITIFSIFLIGFTLLKLSEDWFYLNREENRSLKNRNQQIQSQLASLRSQINPHFLFNALNVVYALALENKKETTEAIVQLSDILRYVIYDSNTERVSLKNEITLLTNYIEFQKFRHNTSNKIEFTHIIDNENYQIYPMLLLPFVENSFKYGIKGDTENTFVNISINLTANEFKFTIENNYNKASLQNEKEHSGFGIENVMKNLEIVYPNTHVFKIDKTDTRFKVSLKLLENEN